MSESSKMITDLFYVCEEPSILMAASSNSLDFFMSYSEPRFCLPDEESYDFVLIGTLPLAGEANMTLFGSKLEAKTPDKTSILDLAPLIEASKTDEVSKIKASIQSLSFNTVDNCKGATFQTESLLLKLENMTITLDSPYVFTKPKPAVSLNPHISVNKQNSI